ncbi:hypothetical protein [Burkholderia gladioli]|uniref:hypothetical protein n=1 Tax=Burkholderia gladioli TaxID=28095 RepID=UPI00164158C9|nr:hypothetical protein [Burkholderia gladioli]
MSIHTEGWAIIGSAGAALASIAGNIYLARKNRSQVIEQAAKSFQQAAESLDVQRTSTARAAATFIADKRQKWIDDLRDDVSLYVALTKEIVAGWRRIFSRLGSRWDEIGPPRAPRELEVYSEDVRKFAEGIAERDSLHAQALTRIMLRLNGEERAHQELTEALYEVRAALGIVSRNADRHEYANQEIYEVIDNQLQRAQISAKVILSEEWRKLKREVANPDRLIENILATTPADDAVVKALVQKPATSAPAFVASDPGPALSK